MIEIKLKQIVNASPHQLATLLLDHVGLERFVNAKFSIIRTANEGELPGGKGCQRQVSTLGNRFVEEIIKADSSAIHYQIVGDRPLKNHRGEIHFKAQGDGTLVHYHIVGETPFWMPSRLVQWLISRDIDNALNKIAAHFAQ